MHNDASTKRNLFLTVVKVRNASPIALRRLGFLLHLRTLLQFDAETGGVPWWQLGFRWVFHDDFRVNKISKSGISSRNGGISILDRLYFFLFLQLLDDRNTCRRNSVRTCFFVKRWRSNSAFQSIQAFLGPKVGVGFIAVMRL